MKQEFEIPTCIKVVKVNCKKEEYTSKSPPANPYPEDSKCEICGKQAKLKVVTRSAILGDFKVIATHWNCPTCAILDWDLMITHNDEFNF